MRPVPDILDHFRLDPALGQIEREHRLSPGRVQTLLTQRGQLKPPKSKEAEDLLDDNEDAEEELEDTELTNEEREAFAVQLRQFFERIEAQQTPSLLAASSHDWLT